MLTVSRKYLSILSLRLSYSSNTSRWRWPPNSSSSFLTSSGTLPSLAFPTTNRIFTRFLASKSSNATLVGGNQLFRRISRRWRYCGAIEVNTPMKARYSGGGSSVASRAIVFGKPPPFTRRLSSTRGRFQAPSSSTPPSSAPSRCTARMSLPWACWLSARCLLVSALSISVRTVTYTVKISSAPASRLAAVETDTPPARPDPAGFRSMLQKPGLRKTRVR
mmetsp:Transcript_36381/g.102781  ORF Transcript_36381/g.102781 Transcript_36381/m.102781 type:complete len:220 (+) Transcript_36381:738-1397(+)